MARASTGETVRSSNENRTAAAIESGSGSCGREFNIIPTFRPFSDPAAFLPRSLVGTGGFGCFTLSQKTDLHS